MDVQLMLRTAVVLLVITGAGGLVMAWIRFKGRPRPPSWLAMLHGLLAGSGLTLLLYAAFTNGLSGGAGWGLGALVVAAAGGVFLNLSYHVKDRPLPVSIMLIHAALAVGGLVLLAIAVWR